MKNIKRTASYMKLLHSIESCTNITQLITLRESVLNYHKKKQLDYQELLAIYIEREHDLSVFDYEEDSIESLHHQRTCGAH